MHSLLLHAGVGVAAVLGLLGTAAAAATIPSACHATLTPQDAREIALYLPNARAFAEARHATMSTALAGKGLGGAVLVRVVAAFPDSAPLEVGVYAVNLHTGAVLDDDQEPADDAAAQAEAAKLLARRCTR